MIATFFFTGGGSGGHIYPGLAVAGEVRRLWSTVSRPGVSLQIIFVCSDRPLDARILSEAGETFVTSPAKPLLLRPKGILRFALNWGKAVRQGRTLLREHMRAKNEEVRVVAMGGFVAAPWVQAAKVERIPATMVNLDAVPGKANRWIAPRVQQIFTAARVRLLPPGKVTWTEVPPIVRATVSGRGSPEECRTRLGLDPDRPTLMVTGGSQGLRSLNDFVTAIAASSDGRKALASQRWQILHQSGRNFDAGVRAAYTAAGVDALVQPFSSVMGDWWGAADLVVATAGAGTVAEIWANKVPGMLLPYPHHRDQHQRLNALALEQVGGVIVGVDRIDPDANIAHNGEALIELLTGADHRAQMRHALDQLGPADGATRIAQALLDALK